MRAELFGREVPVTVGNFIELAAKGFYDNLKFHAKKPGSVVLGGCPTTRTMGPAQVLAAAQGAIRGMHPGTGTRAIPSSTSGRATLATGMYLAVCVWPTSPRPTPAAASSISRWANSPSSTTSIRWFGQVTEGLEVIEQLAIGDAIRSIAIEGADEEALAAATAAGNAAAAHAPKPLPPSSASGRSAPPARQPR